MTMRSYAIGGIILIVAAVLILSVHSITYFSHDQEVGPLGFFAWDVSRPHTIFLNPIAGVVALAVGVGLLVLGRRPVLK
jgi:hypothetical protein